MTWWAWLLLGAFGPYVLAFILVLDWTLLAMVRKLRYQVSYPFDKGTKLAVVFVIRGRYRTIGKNAGTTKTAIHVAHQDLDEALQTVREFFE